jgi:hypothetical protein
MLKKQKHFLAFWGIALGLVSVTSTAQTGNPYYSVLSYGAFCDGNSHIQNGIDLEWQAFHNAITAAKTNGGGVVFVPSSVAGACVITTQLTDLRGATGITLAGPPACVPFANVAGIPKPTILFTGTASPLIDATSTNQVSFKSLSLEYNNPSFNGTFIDLSSTGLTFGDSIVDCNVQGQNSSAAGANPLIRMDKGVSINIERNGFNWAWNAIVGQANSGSFDNAIRIRDNIFQNISLMILNLGQGWIIEGNIFEMTGTSSTYPIAIDGITVGCTACIISGNWMGDASSSYSDFMIQGNFQGSVIAGNYFQGAPNLTAQGMYIGGSGVTITGNTFYQLAWAYDLPNGGTDMIVEGNNYTSVTGILFGHPTSGIVEDNVGNRTIYGNVNIQGTLTKSSGAFRIDHPLDPERKYLQHLFVESPDMLNIYDGVAVLDSHGKAIVRLPSYFEALNRDFRYQLTCIGSAAPVYIAREIHNNRFIIAGGRPGLRVSWQVTGVRHDAYANEHRIVVEEDKKTEKERPPLSSPRSSHDPERTGDR